MNSILFAIILVPIVEIYLLIKIGGNIGAISTILLIFTTAIVGVYYAKYEGLNTLKSGFLQLSKNETPTYEMLSGAAIAFAALLLIIPGFVTDILGFLLIFPISRKFIFNLLSKKIKRRDSEKNNFIEPLFAFVPSVGISSLNKCPLVLAEYYKKPCLLALSLYGNDLRKGHSIIIFLLNDDLNKVHSIEKIRLGNLALRHFVTDNKNQLYENEKGEIFIK